MRLRAASLVILAALFVALTASAHADTVTFTLVDASGDLSSTPGTLTYEATVFAPATNGAAVFLNGDSFSVAVPLGLDSSDFFANFPLFLDPGDSFTGDLFTLTVPSGTPLFTLGTFTLLGGTNGGASDVLGTVNFSLTITPESITTTPEPSSFVLLGSGLLGVAGLVRKRFV